MDSSRETARPVRWGFTPSILMAVVLNPLNSATISVGLTILLRAFHSSSEGITWIVSGYYLGSAVAQPIMGRLGDRFGYRRFFYWGLTLVLITAILAPLSHQLWVFVGWRVVQAIGTSMVYPNAIGLVRQWQTKRLPTILGWIGMAAGIALAVGPPVGGLLIAHFGWQAIFWLNIPIAIAAGLLLAISIPHTTRPSSSVKPHEDVLGSVLFVLLMLAFLQATNKASVVGSLGGLMILVVLIVAEKRHDYPTIPVRWFLRRAFTLAALITLLTNLVMYLALYGIPIFLETDRHLSVSMSGFMLLLFAATLAVASPLGGYLARSQSRRSPILLSSILLVAASLILWSQSWASLIWIGLALVLLGLSFAVTNVVLQQMFLELAPAHQSGTASGLYSLLRYVGTIASSVVLAQAFEATHTLVVLFVALTMASALSGILSVGLPVKTKRKDTL